MRVYKGVLLVSVLAIAVLAGSCFAGMAGYVSWTNPEGGLWQDPNNWSDGNVPEVNTVDWDSGYKASIGTWYDAGSTFGHAVINQDTNAYMVAVGSHIHGYGILDILPGATLNLSGFLTSEDTYDSWAVINVYGNVKADYPGQWSKLARDGITYWNQYSGNVSIVMNYWCEGDQSILYLNVYGGEFKAIYKPIPKRGKAFINVRGTGTVKLDGWEDGYYPRPGGGTWITVNGAGKLILYGDWTADPTAGGIVSSNHNLIAVAWPENPDYTEITTDACGLIEDGDFDADCDVDFQDLCTFALDWLN